MYLTLGSAGKALHWLTRQQLRELLAQAPASASALPGLDGPPGPYDPPFVGLRILDRRLFLEAMAKVESERAWGHKLRSGRRATARYVPP